MKIVLIQAVSKLVSRVHAIQSSAAFPPPQQAPDAFQKVSTGEAGRRPLEREKPPDEDAPAASGGGEDGSRSGGFECLPLQFHATPRRSSIDNAGEVVRASKSPERLSRGLGTGVEATNPSG